MQHGEITRLAKQAKITPQYMAQIIKRQRRPSADLSKILEEVTGIDRRAWQHPDEFPNPMIQQDTKASNG